ncbi:hypothetical protein ACFVGM_08820 [Kitasatospora purpeofusca]|uniref:hypothetical protein n=1 Tax=Kitasatospora purpeofusca TaxID=67352 RepID=UPI00369CD1C1
MRELLSTALAVFFVWNAGLRTLVSLVTTRLPDAPAEVVRFATVGAASWTISRHMPSDLLFFGAVGGLVVLANVGVRALGAHADGPALTVRRDRPPGPGRPFR